MKISSTEERTKAYHHWGSEDPQNFKKRERFPLCKQTIEKFDWEDGSKNTLLIIFTVGTKLFPIFKAKIVSIDNEVLFLMSDYDKNSLIYRLKCSRYIPKKLKISSDKIYFNRHIWRDLSKNTLIRIKLKKGNGGNRKKKTKSSIRADIISINGAILFFINDASTKTEAKKRIRQSNLVPKNLVIGAGETYFNRIKQTK